LFLKAAEYSTWYESEHDRYGHIRKLNGNRVYCTEKMIDGKTVILILRGNKNGQDKAFRRAQKIAEKIHGD